MFKCLECGHIFDDGEQGTRSESRGEFWGESCTETISCCPICKGDYEETEKCEICGGEHFPDELTDGICEECIKNYETVETCYKVGKSEKETVKINCFLAETFAAEEIEKILIDILRKGEHDVDCAKFVKNDKYWFIDSLKEVLKNENK